MLFASAVANLAAEGESHAAVAIQTLPYGIVTLVIFAVLGMVTASYRHVANRHAAPVAHDEQH